MSLENHLTFLVLFLAARFDTGPFEITTKDLRKNYESWASLGRQYDPPNIFPKPPQYGGAVKCWWVA